MEIDGFWNLIKKSKRGTDHCQEQSENLELNRGGGHGPIDIYAVHEATQ
jgi:hypothetical protein